MSHFLRLAAILIALALAGLPTTPAFAALVTLVASSATVDKNESFSVDLYMDAADTLGAHPGSYGGNVVISFDPNLATYDGFVFNTPATLLNPPGVSIGSDGGLQTISFGFNNAADVGTITTLNFTSIGPYTSFINFTVADQDDFFGTFANHMPTNQPFIPAFTGTAVQIVPLPAAFWLMLSGLGAIGGLGARRLRS